MRKLLVFVSFGLLPLLGATLLNQNLYERQNRVDLMLSFDAVYTGGIKKNTDGREIVLILADARTQERYEKELTHPFLRQIVIAPGEEGSTRVAFVPKKPIDVQAAKTTDGYGLRLRVVADAGQKQQPAADTDAKTQADEDAAQEKSLDFTTKDPVELSPAYIITVAVLLLIAVTLFIAKKKVSAKGGSWLMPKSGYKKSSAPAFSIRFQKVIDSKNKIVLMEYEGREYLTVIGNSNILLDVFENGSVASKSEFEDMFEKHKEELNDYIRVGHSKSDGRLQEDEDSFTANAERV